MRTDPAAASAVKSADRVLQILELLGRSPSALTPAAVAEQTGIPRSSLHGLLRTLRTRGWVEDAGSGAVALAARALAVGVAYLDRDPVVELATPTLERLRDELGCTVNLARRVGDGVLYLATREAADRRSLPSRVGRVVPASATALGRALLAELTDAEVRSLLERSERAPLTDRTLTAVDALADEVRASRDRGDGRETGETLDDVACVAVVVPYRIPATDAVSCSMPADQADDRRLEEVVAVLRREVDRLARDLRARGVR